MIFLSLGTLIHRFIMQSMLVFMRNTGSFDIKEYWVIMGILLASLIYSFLFAKWICIWLLNDQKHTSKPIFLLILSIGSLLALVYWFLPLSAKPSQIIKSDDGHFVGGPYPDSFMLKRLKAEGFTDVISLLDNFLAPKEPLLLLHAENTARSLHLNFIHIPILPGQTPNDRLINIVQPLVSNANKKYYVYTYYGQERVEMFMAMVNMLSDKNIKMSQRVKKFDEIPYLFENGKAMRIDPHLIVGPTLNYNDVKKFILKVPNPYLDGVIKNVLFLKDEGSELPSSVLIDALKMSDVNFMLIPLATFPYNSSPVLSLAKKIKALPGMVYLYSYNMPPESISLSGVILSYLTNLPAIPSILLTEPMANGKPKLLAANIVIGSYPDAGEFKSYLRPRGINKIIYIGSCKDKHVLIDESLSKMAKISWSCYDRDDWNQLINTVMADGPWYLYGAKLHLVLPLLKEKINIAEPDIKPYLIE